MWLSSKKFGHELGLSACFRQPRANSHCRLLHGYALSFKFEFAAKDLDANNWVVDFGSLKPLKMRLENLFDHKMLIDSTDPLRHVFDHLNNTGAAEVIFLPDGVGCEAFAKMAYDMATEFIIDARMADRVIVVSAECAEHGANSATYLNSKW
jgi:6-pyruvoyltetrahydropterin/6-carboxytetrahydropterin synthase